ncbi:MAG: YncE family protein [Nitrososphaeraceae archaeon]
MIITWKSHGLAFKLNSSLLAMVIVVSIATIAIMVWASVIITFVSDGSFSLLGTAKADSVIDTIPAGKGPMGIDYDSANGNMYVANFYSNTVSVIDDNTNKVIVRIPFASNTSPADVAFNSDNGNIYVTNYNAGNVSVINGNTNRVIDVISGLRQGVFAIAFNSANGNIYVTNYNAGNVSVINGNTNRVISTIFVGGNPTAIAVNSANGDVYVADGINGVGVINPITNRLVDTVSVGHGPSGLAFNPANGNMYVANFYSNTVSVIDTGTNNVIHTIPMLFDYANPSGIVYNPTNNYLYVASYYNLSNAGFAGGSSSSSSSSSGTVSVIDGSTNNIVANMLVGKAPQDAAFNSANDQVYITNLLSNTVSVISSSSIDDPVQSIQALIQTIQSMSTISQDIQASLVSTLNTAMFILSTNYTGNYIAACNHLNAFNNQVYGGVQYGLIDQSSGIQLVQSNQAIQQALGC